MKTIDNFLKTKKNNAFDKFIISTLFVVAGFLLGCARIMDKPCALSLAFISVSKNRCYVFSSIGACLGYITFGLNEMSVRYLAGVFVAFVLTLLWDILSLSHKRLLSLLTTGAAGGITGLFMLIRLGAEANEYLLLLSEILLSIGAGYFYFNAINANLTRFRLRALPQSDLAAILISLSTLLLSIADLEIFMLHPARIIASIIVLFTIRFENERLGVTLGIIFGFFLGLSSNDILLVCGVMGFSALVAGIMSSMSSLGIGIGYLCCIGFFSICIGGKIGLFLFLDNLIGVGLFLVTPSFICDKIEELLDNGKDVAPDGTLRQNLVLKLRFASSAMAAISDSVNEVREKINAIARRENEAERYLISDEEYITKEIILEKTNQIRMVASDQFFSIADMLNDLAEEFDTAEVFDANAAAKIRRFLGEYEIYPTNISAIIDKYSRMRVEILISGWKEALTDSKIGYEIGKICNRYFDKGVITHFKNDTLLSFNERPSYKMSIGYAQNSAEGELCGDTIKCITDKSGHAILIISDGMGKGNRAALDGAMGAGLLTRLINAGFGFDSALKVINSALLIKSNDESLATLDIASVDLFTGKCEIFKAGAPASYIIKGNAITKCELTSMPAGILRGIEFAKRTAVLSPDDFVLLMSDGITDLGDEWLQEALSAMDEIEPQKCAEYILNKAIEAMQNEKMDDMSIIFARMERN